MAQIRRITKINYFSTVTSEVVDVGR